MVPVRQRVPVVQPDPAAVDQVHNKLRALIDPAAPDVRDPTRRQRVVVEYQEAARGIPRRVEAQEEPARGERLGVTAGHAGRLHDPEEAAEESRVAGRVDVHEDLPPVGRGGVGGVAVVGQDRARQRRLVHEEAPPQQVVPPGPVVDVK